jgi:nicotinamide mononucleotide transporter
MEQIKKFYCSFNWNWFELLLIGIVTVISGYYFGIAIVTGDWIFALIDFIAAIAGIFSVVLCAKGKKSGFIFGLINVVGYSIIAFNSQYYGEVMLNTLFYIPMNIISYINWNKHQEIESKEVERRSLNWKQIGIGVIGVAIITFLYHLVLASLGGAMTLLDGTTTVLSIVATLLMASRYAEQWLCWIVVDAITVIMWIVAADSIMITMWSAYLINAFYGYYKWKYQK